VSGNITGRRGHFPNSAAMMRNPADILLRQDLLILL
jgi:hypothetical protein